MAEICLPNVYLKPSVERRIQNRLKRIEGQVRGIQRLITEHHSCDDILIQIGAVKQAVNSVAVALLEGHMDTCVAASVEKGQGAKALASLKGALAHVLRQGA
jgi:DNA-binding FrmR family transcriptional regulator